MFNGEGNYLKLKPWKSPSKLNLKKNLTFESSPSLSAFCTSKRNFTNNQALKQEK